jgi:hypothetical protein
MANAPNPDSNNLRANIQELVSRVDFGVSIRRMDNIEKGIDGFDFFGKNSMLANCIGFEVTDSLDSFFKTGKVVLADETALNELLPLTGNEVVAIRYKNLVSDVASGEKIVYFRIFAITETDNFQNANAKSSSKFIVLNLVEFPAFEMFSLSAVYKSYAGNNQKISKIIFDMLSEIPFIDKYYQLKNPLPTKGTMDFWIPHWTPMKTMTYLQQYAVSQLNEPMYALRITQDQMDTRSNSYKKQSLNFTSVYNLFNNSGTRTYSTIKAEQRYRNVNVAGTGSGTDTTSPTPSAEDDRNNSPHDVILAKSIISNDASMSFAGLNGFTLIGRNQNGTKSFPITYQSFMSNYKVMGKYGVFPVDPNKVWGNQWSKYINTHLDPDNKEIIEAYQNNLFSRRTLLGAEKALIYCYVNEFRKPGEKANLILPSGDPEKIIDFMRSGSYLTWSVTDKVMASGEGVSEIKVVRDSFYLIDNVKGYLPSLNSNQTNKTLTTIQSE